MKIKKIARASVIAAVMASLLLTGCGNKTTDTTADAIVEEAAETYENSEDGGHAILADGEDAEYSGATIVKTGDSEGDEADFYGENSAVFATNGAHLTLQDMTITTDGTHANAVFSYGEGTVVDISDSTIETSGNCSGGIMTTGGGTTNATNLTIHTTGRSSASIRSDRGGGTVTVNGGTYTTEGVGSPTIYSTADITVNDAALTSTASQGVVVEGKNSVTLNNCVLSADNNEHNSDKSDVFEAVMIYQSMSGDADTGLSEFTATGGSITNANGDIFFVNNTATDITLSGVAITNNGDGAFLRAAAAGWGNEGSNGGKVNLYASAQTIDGNMIVDDISVLNLYLKDSSTFNGAINTDGAAGDVYVELTGDSKWVLTGDSYIKSLTCDTDSIDLNGYTLYVDGKAYTAGSTSSGEAIEITAESNGNGSSGSSNKSSSSNSSKSSSGTDSKSSSDSNENAPTPPDGSTTPPDKPDGDNAPTPPDGSTTPPDKPAGDNAPTPPDGSTTPPDKPDESATTT